jgi:hypothetical protein
MSLSEAEHAPLPNLIGFCLLWHHTTKPLSLNCRQLKEHTENSAAALKFLLSCLGVTQSR